MDVDRTDRIEGSPGGGTPTQDSNHGDVDMRLSTTSQSIQSVVAVASNVPNSQPGFQTKRRCRDFDGLYCPGQLTFELLKINQSNIQNLHLQKRDIA